MFANLFLSGVMLQRAGLPLWVWLLLFVIVVLIVIFAAMRNAKESGTDVEVHAHADHAEVAPAPEAPVTPDDLTKIEGIGPKISSVFHAAGITTFVKMAATEASALQKILDDANIRLGNPETWPEQAALAAKGDWAALEKLQDQLQGGRRA
ncbi:MAG: hypothetical protein H8E28_11330 [Anaerolineae bacterium]|nr:hypothetical protein [Anaerolineae bacterium]